MDDAHLLSVGEYVILSNVSYDEEGFLGASTNDDVPVVKGIEEDGHFRVLPVNIDPGTVFDDSKKKPLLFGMPVMLEHRRTGKFIASEESGTGLRLEKHPKDKRAQFRLVAEKSMEGERIVTGSNVFIEHIELGGKVSQERTVSPSGHYSVLLVYPSGAEDLSTPWKITFSPVSRRNNVTFGSLIRFFDSKAGFLRAFGKLVRARKYDEGEEKRQSYKSVWEIETIESVLANREVKWSQPFRLRLFGTKLYLCYDVKRREENVHTKDGSQYQVALTQDKKK